MKNEKLKNLTLAAMFLCMGYVLPFFTGQMKEIGSMLLPMHIPVLLTGFICGWKYGLIVGFILPVTRSLIFGMPIMYPYAVAMAFELATYGFVSGYLYFKYRWKCVKSLLRCLIISMISGRIVWGITQMILLGIKGGSFTLAMFISGAFLNAIPGIIIQIILIPVLMVSLHKAKFVRFGRK